MGNQVFAQHRAYELSMERRCALGGESVAELPDECVMLSHIEPSPGRVFCETCGVRLWHVNAKKVGFVDANEAGMRLHYIYPEALRQGDSLANHPVWVGRLLRDFTLNSDIQTLISSQGHLSIEIPEYSHQEVRNALTEVGLLDEDTYGEHLMVIRGVAS